MSKTNTHTHKHAHIWTYTWWGIYLYTLPSYSHLFTLKRHQNEAHVVLSCPVIIRPPSGLLLRVCLKLLLSRCHCLEKDVQRHVFFFIFLVNLQWVLGTSFSIETFCVDMYVWKLCSMGLLRSKKPSGNEIFNIFLIVLFLILSLIHLCAPSPSSRHSLIS